MVARSLAYPGRMIYFNAAAYSPNTHARFRSSLAMDRFVSAPHNAGRAASLRWARAWMLAAEREESAGAPCVAPAPKLVAFRSSNDRIVAAVDAGQS